MNEIFVFLEKRRSIPLPTRITEKNGKKNE